MRAYVTYLVIRGVAAFAGATAFTLNLVYQAEVAGLGPLELVLVGTVLEAVCFVAQVPTGVLADLYSRRLSVIVGYLLIGAGIMVEGLVPAFAAILVANVVWGVGATFVDGAQEAWVVDEVGAERAPDALVRGSQVAQASSVAGIVASVVLAGAGLNVPIVVAATAWLVLGLVLVVVMPERGFTPAPPEERGSWRSMRGQALTAVRATRGDPALMLLLAALLCTAFAGEGLDRLTQLHFLDDVGFPSAGTPAVWFGVLSVAGMFCAIGFTELIRRSVDLADPARLARALAVLQAACVGAIVVFALADRFWLAAAASVCVGLLRAAAGPLVGAWLAARTEAATRATVYSLVSQVDAAGQLVGGPPLGLTAERLSIRAALLGAAAIIVPAVPFLVGAARRVPIPSRRPPVDRRDVYGP
ncbi:MFS transporter [Streptosporangium sp. 'caverna']|uniref:MFS transporter n=1 Tax=Streptosporangium sp. 'caverna' TaxID=2202249 RepID=UPI0013A6D3D6|nr:MFS transporter [Streptosporangium sp. 'caverna']